MSPVITVPPACQCGECGFIMHTVSEGKGFTELVVRGYTLIACGNHTCSMLQINLRLPIRALVLTRDITPDPKKANE